MRLLLRHLLRDTNYLFGKLFIYFSAIRIIPHILFYLLEYKNCPLKEDMEAWKRNYPYVKWRDNGAITFIKLMLQYPEFRNVFYYRAHWQGGIFEFLCPPMNTLFLNADQIGPGIFISHGFSTIIAAKSIGKNVHIHQQTTIGWRSGGCPTIGDNVQIGAGAIITGKINIGNNSKIGAGSIVVNDVKASDTIFAPQAKVRT